MIDLVQALVRAEAFMRDAGVAFALVGGAAIVARVRPRMTDDLDFIVAWEPAALDALLAIAGRHGLTLEPSAMELAAEGLVRLRGGDDDPPLDLIRADSPFLAQVISRASPVGGGLPPVPVASLEDLVLLKLEAERPIDIDDVLAIKDAHEGRLDRGYLDAEARRLGLDARVGLYLGHAPAR